MSNPRNRRTEVTRFDLVSPIPYAGEDLVELVFYKPRGKTLRIMRDGARSEGQIALELVEELTEIPIAVLDLLDFEDAQLAAMVAADLVEKKSEAATIRAAELGVEIDEALPEEAAESAVEAVA